MNLGKMKSKFLLIQFFLLFSYFFFTGFADSTMTYFRGSPYPDYSEIFDFLWVVYKKLMESSDGYMIIVMFLLFTFYVGNIFFFTLGNFSVPKVSRFFFLTSLMFVLISMFFVYLSISLNVIHHNFLSRSFWLQPGKVKFFYFAHHFLFSASALFFFVISSCILLLSGEEKVKNEDEKNFAKEGGQREEEVGDFQTGYV